MPRIAEVNLSLKNERLDILAGKMTKQVMVRFNTRIFNEKALNVLLITKNNRCIFAPTNHL